MTGQRRTARALTGGAGLAACAGLCALPDRPALAAVGLYLAAVLAWFAVGYRAAHHRTTAEAAWERRRVLGEAPPPLNPCCLLATTSGGQAHDARCTDEFRRITLHLPDHPWSTP
ncbi:hypothetical protein ACFW2X_06635 [Streptomyces antibioticus]|uniref:hypothetical protein n=1 Tax=Streptomyces antibioticus TaxID=1890 RepID=UPI00369E914C